MKLTRAVYLRIQELAALNKLTVYGLAKKCGVPRSTISTLRVSKSVGTGVLYAICEGLEITLKDFFDSPLFARESLMD